MCEYCKEDMKGKSIENSSLNKLLPNVSVES